MLAVGLVGIYMALNVRHHPRRPAGNLRAIRELVAIWKASLFAQHGDPLMMGAMAIILFPKLALGLSGFETGVAVMPLVQGDATDTEESPARADPQHEEAPVHGGASS